MVKKIERKFSEKKTSVKKTILDNRISNSKKPPTGSVLKLKEQKNLLK